MTVRPRLAHILLLPFALAAGAALAAPRMLKRGFTPPKPPVDVIPSDIGLHFEVVQFKSVNDTRLHAWWIPAEGAAPVIIVLHGWGGNSSLMLPLAPHIHDAGFHALFVDARNHGLSEPDSFSSMPRFAEDLEVAVEWARTHDDVTAVGVIGHSVGAGALIFSASKGVPIDAAVSVSSFAHPGEMMHEQMPFPKPVVSAILEAVQRTIGYRFEEFAPRTRVVSVDIPLLLVHGDKDDVVPIANLHQLAKAHGGAEVIIVPGGGHSNLEPFEPYIDDIVEFFARNLAT
ncbi:MAG: alpha/beta fold hydrolase [Actinomycetota bacterium]